MPILFTSLSVKVVDNFWKVRGVIDRFNESRRHIASGVDKTAYESMSAIQFCTAPKINLSRYSYIFSNTEPLGKEMNNVACSRLGNMFHLAIQKGKEAIKKSIFKKWQSDCSLNEETNSGYKMVCPTGVK